MDDYLFSEMNGVPVPEPPKIDPYDGFEQWWEMVPRFKRKYGKSKCKVLWMTKKLWQHKDQIIAAQEHYNRRINKGEFAPVNDPANKYKYYPNPHAWLNQHRWEIELPPTAPPGPSVATVKPEQPRLSPDAARAALEAGLAKAGMVMGKAGGIYRMNNNEQTIK